MYREINAQINTCKQEMQRKNKLNSMLSSLQSELSSEQRKLIELSELLNKENIDVEKLSKLSITSLFYTILGTKEERLDKEKQEVLAAKLRYSQCEKSIASLQAEENELLVKLQQLRDCDRLFRALMEQKNKLIMDSGDGTAQRLLSLMDTGAQLRANVKELDEAIFAGKEVLRSIRNTIDSLESAKGWGTWDMLGGGLISDLAKHSHIDDAQDHASETQRLLGRFKRELSDVHIVSSEDIQIGSFSKFADFFFDGLLFDWSVYAQIKDSLSSVSEMHERIDQLVLTLVQERAKQTNGLTTIDKEISQLIEQA